MQTLKGRTCAFAGATAGDGREVAKALCAGGMNVIVITHMPQSAQSLVEEIQKKNCPGKVYILAETEETLSEGFKKAVKQFGSLDVIISNTGGAGRANDVDSTTPDELMENVDHIVRGSFSLLKETLPYLRKSLAPRVIFISSVEGCKGGTQESFSDSVAKGAIRALTINTAARLAKERITVNCIAKGAIPRVDPLHEGDVNAADRLPEIPMGRLGTSEDLAGTVCFFASEESSYVTGQVLELGGGI